MKLPANPEVRYQAIIGQQVAGPYTMEGLQSLVYLGKVTPDTLVTLEGRFEFTAIRSSAYFVHKLFPQIKQTEAQTAEAQANDQLDRQHYQMTEAKFEKVADQAGPRGRIDVMEILGEIRQSEIASGRDHVRLKRFRISKRSRDFWFMLIVGNLILVGGGIAMQNTSSIVFGFAGSGMYTFGLLWSMYGVMDRY